MVQRVGSARRYRAAVRAMMVGLCALIWWTQGVPLHAQTATMRWLGRIDTGVNLWHRPVLVPQCRSGQDWVFWPRRTDSTVEYFLLHFDSLEVDSSRLVWTKGIEEGLFFPNRVTVADINGDGQSEIFGSETHFIRSTPTGHVIDSIDAGAVLGGAMNSDIDGDGYGEAGGTHIFWGDSAGRLSTRSVVAWQPHAYPTPSWYAQAPPDDYWGEFTAQGKTFALIISRYRQYPSAPSDTTSSIEMTVRRVVRLKSTDIASHADTIHVDTTWTPQDFIHIVQTSYFGTRIEIGYAWPSIELAYDRNGRFMIESGGPGTGGYALRCIVDSLGMTCDTTTHSDTSWSALGLSSRTYTSTVLEPDEFALSTMPTRDVYMLLAFPHPDSLFLAIQKFIVFPDSLATIRNMARAGGGFRFPDITGDGKRELALVYEHVTLGPVIDIFDIWGAVVTSTGGGGGAVRGTVEPTVTAGRLRWAGGDDGPTTVRLYDTAGRLLRSTTIDGLELAIRGIDCTGQSGPVAVSFTTASGKHMATTIFVE